MASWATGGARWVQLWPPWTTWPSHLWPPWAIHPWPPGQPPLATLSHPSLPPGQPPLATWAASAGARLFFHACCLNHCDLEPSVCLPAPLSPAAAVLEPSALLAVVLHAPPARPPACRPACLLALLLLLLLLLTGGLPQPSRPLSTCLSFPLPNVHPPARTPCPVLPLPPRWRSTSPARPDSSAHSAGGTGSTPPSASGWLHCLACCPGCRLLPGVDSLLLPGGRLVVPAG